MKKIISYFKDSKGIGGLEVLAITTVTVVLVGLWQLGVTYKSETYAERKKTGMEITAIFEDPNVDLNKTYDAWRDKLMERLYGSGKTAISIYDDYGIHTFINETTDLYKVKTDDKPDDNPSIQEDIKQTIKDRVEDFSGPDATEKDKEEVSDKIIDKFFLNAKQIIGQKVGSSSTIIKDAIAELLKRKIAADKKQVELKGQKYRLIMEIKSLKEQMEFMEEQSGGYIDEYEDDYYTYTNLKSRLDTVDGMLIDVEAQLKSLSEVLTTQIEAASATGSEDIDEVLQEAATVNIEDVIGNYSTEFVWMWTEELDSANGVVSFTVDSNGNVSGQYFYKWIRSGSDSYDWGTSQWNTTAEGSGPISGHYDVVTNKLKIETTLTATSNYVDIVTNKDSSTFTNTNKQEWLQYTKIEASWIGEKFTGSHSSWPVDLPEHIQTISIEIPKN